MAFAGGRPRLSCSSLSYPVSLSERGEYSDCAGDSGENGMAPMPGLNRK